MSDLQRHESAQRSELKWEFMGETVVFRSLGSLYLPQRNCLVVSDLHLGKSERHARLGGSLFPPFEAHETLDRLEQDLEDTKAKWLVFLGDSFDDDEAVNNLHPKIHYRIQDLVSGLRCFWIAGNHDDQPIPFTGKFTHELNWPPLSFRHMATLTGHGEISGHYHPKASVSAKGRRISRPCFLVDRNRIIMPAYGAYTGGLSCHAQPLRQLMRNEAIAVLTGLHPTPIALASKNSRLMGNHPRR